MKKILVLLFLLIPINVYASSGAIAKDNTMKKGSVIYGYHGKDNHCHKVKEKDGKYYADTLIDDSYCTDIIKANSLRFTVEFSKCVDGDTMKVLNDKKEVTVRFLAIDTEESVSSTKENTYMGKVASDYTCNRIKKAKKLEIEYDPGSDKLDKYNRVLGWVYVDDVLLQQELVEIGYAKVAYLYGDYLYTDDLVEVESIAKSAELGIWEEESFISKLYSFIKKLIKLFT